jgi:circadian clock protein KaiC
MLTRILDLLKRKGITLLMTALTGGQPGSSETDMHVSSMVDTWLKLTQEFTGHGRRRDFYIVKSRGMEHSQETRELIMSSQGMSLREPERDHA